jgi:hypothetical protein
MTFTVQPPTEQPRKRRRFGLVPALAILAIGGLVLAIVNGQRQHDPADDSTQHDIVNTASGAAVEASATCDAGSSLVQVRITGLTDAAGGTVRVSVDTDTTTTHADDIADGRTTSVQIGATGDGGDDLDRIASGPATVRLIQTDKGVTATAHLTIPTCPK